VIVDCDESELPKLITDFSQRSIGGVEIDERDRKDYYSPSTELFADYCASIIDRYGLSDPGLIQKQEVADITYDYLPEDKDTPVSNSKTFTITTTTGQKFYSRSTVLAIGAGGAGVSKIFPWRPASEEEGASACCHSMEIKSFPSPNVRRKIQHRQETNVVVVGGGLSSAQIVDMAIRKGVTKVWFLMRSGMKGMCLQTRSTQLPQRYLQFSSEALRYQSSLDG
jgi:cation diffusion facilitator CzcD-associated flavoprotein CzcO